MKKLIFILLCIGFSKNIEAQNENKHIREGNNLYEDGKYTESQSSYLKALEKNSKSYSGAFNLGDALYKQEKYEEAANQFNVLSQSAPDKISKAKAFHNQGNSLLKAKKLEESINAYKNALKNNPKDEDTRYNLAYAQQMLRQQQQQQQDNKDDKKEQDDKKEEQKKDQEQKDKKEEQKEQEQQQPKEQLSKEEAKQMLDALNNEEKKVQDKLNKKKTGVKVQIEKDW